jgi:HEPN domain-containing protein
MNDSLQAAALLKMAGKDLRALGAMKNSDDFSDEIFGLHSQQVVEKCCKAWLAALSKKYPYTHDISLLLGQLNDAGCIVEKYWEFAGLSAFATNFRYEGLDESALPMDRNKITADLVALYRQVEKIVNSL